MSRYEQILVTRPLPQAQAMMDGLLATGLKISCLPLYKIRPLQPCARWQRIKDNLQNYHTLIFISQNAVELSLPLFKHLTPGEKSANFKNWITWGIGRKTCETLIKYGFNPENPPQPETTEGLIESIKTSNIKTGKCLLIKGRGGRKDLEMWLKETHKDVEIISVYERIPESYPNNIIRNLLKPYSIICFTSGEAIQHLVNLINSTDIDILRYPLVVPSKRVALIGNRLGFRNLSISEGASVESQTQAVLDILRQEDTIS